MPVFSFSQSLNNGNLQTNTITTAVPFLRIGPDSRAAGIGEQGIGLSPDPYAFHWNTAQLGFSDRKFEVATSYFNWLNALVDDVYQLNVAGYGTFGKNRTHSIGGMFSFFDHASVNFTDPFGNIIYTYNGYELRALAGYAIQLSERSSLGVNGQFIYSNLNRNDSLGIHPGSTLAGDISYAYTNSDIMLGGLNSTLRWGVTFSNLGGKIKYTSFSSDNGDFIPANLRLGASYGVNFTDQHNLSIILGFKKLLVLSPPVYDGMGNIISGVDPDSVSVPGSWVHSFYDAPGEVTYNSMGQPEIVKGSRFKEEMREYIITAGLEYNFDQYLSARVGFFHEHYSKGNRKFLSFGLGGGYYGFRFDMSYWLALRQNNPLANTMKFTLTYNLDRGE